MDGYTYRLAEYPGLTDLIVGFGSGTDTAVPTVMAPTSIINS